MSCTTRSKRLQSYSFYPDPPETKLIDCSQYSSQVAFHHPQRLQMNSHPSHFSARPSLRGISCLPPILWTYMRNSTSSSRRAWRRGEGEVGSSGEELKERRAPASRTAQSSCLALLLSVTVSPSSPPGRTSVSSVRASSLSSRHAPSAPQAHPASYST